mmetsp:Transcript_92487/g.149330  ORF Transcript_92487/g.149330 Transcript_92487/m.149330 type:complete len:269 (-) Transcript_92487:521-1327(-)
MDSGIECKSLCAACITCKLQRSPIDTGRVCRLLWSRLRARRPDSVPMTEGSTSKWFRSIQSSVKDVMSVTSYGKFLSKLLDSERRVRLVVSISSSGMDWMAIPLRSRVIEAFESYMRARYSRMEAVPFDTTSLGGVRRLDLPRSSSTSPSSVPSLGGSVVNLLPPQCSSLSEESMQTTGGSLLSPLVAISKACSLVKCTRDSGRACRLFSARLSCSSPESLANSGGSSEILLPHRLSSLRFVSTKVSMGTAVNPMSIRSRIPLDPASS